MLKRGRLLRHPPRRPEQSPGYRNEQQHQSLEQARRIQIATRAKKQQTSWTKRRTQSLKR
jgi:hypothetical protein